MAPGTGVRHQVSGRGAGRLPGQATPRQGRRLRHPHPRRHYHPLPQHHPHSPGKAHARRPVHGASHPLPGALERPGHGDARQQEQRGARRPHLHLFLRRDPLRRGVQLFLPGPKRHPPGRPDLLPGSQFAGYLCALFPGGALRRGAAGQFPPRGGWQGAVLLSPPLADAGLLAVPHGVHGPRPHPGHLPGPCDALPLRPRPGPPGRPQGVGVSRRWGV